MKERRSKILELFERLNEKQKRLAIAYIRALLGDKESGDERKEGKNKGATELDTPTRKDKN